MNLASTSPQIESATATQQQFLRFAIAPSLTALIEIDTALGSTAGKPQQQRIVELINIQIDRVVPLPHLPPGVMGVYNWRGEILWLVDLAMLVGTATTTRRYRSLQPTIILASTTEVDGSTARVEDRQERQIGLVVDEIAEIEWYDRAQIRPLDPSRAWVRGVWTSTTGADFLVVDGQAIFDRTDFDADV
ncbi:CheW domain-containing protein [Chamaesiphon sp.]|uniref:CheW domain-containing protein n=1 Tax=Chamaesiphon sp. TaxID=2814140 RepID=UPI0035933CDB